MGKKSYFTKDQKEEITDVFAEAFHEVVVPVLEEMPTKKDFARLEKRIDEVGENLANRIEQVNRRNLQVADRHGDRIDNHEKRLKKLEVKTRFAS